jgi:ureidoacrylate peracid hydrolase
MHKLDLHPWFVERAKGLRAGRLNAYETIEGSKTALIVVDMQNYFVDEAMPTSTPMAREIVPNINRLAEVVRAAGGLVVWIQTEAPADPDDWPNRIEASSPEVWAFRQKSLAVDGEGFPVYRTCDVHPEDSIAIKYRYSAFIPYPSPLEALLKKHGIDTLLITGTSTSTCCESTARDASMWGYRTIMVSDGNADQQDWMHNHTLGKFLGMFGDVQATDEVIEKLEAATGLAAGAAAE